QARPPVDAAALARVERWWIVIGSVPGVRGVRVRRHPRHGQKGGVCGRHYARDAQMVVLSGAPRISIDDLPQSTIRLAYVSVGEADPRRPYWPEVRDQPFLVEQNPEGPDTVRVDIRSSRWQELLMCEEISRLMQRGFDGLMLDTIDTVPYLESKDPVRYAGSRQALREWLQRLRAAFPRAVLVANGSDALADAAPYV